MTARALEVVLHKTSDRSWKSDALKLPTVQVVSVSDQLGKSIPFERQDGAVVIEGQSPASLVARLELPEDLVASSALEQSKLDLEHEKIASAERLARRTLVVSVATALVSAATAIAVADITNHPDKSDKPDKPQATAYRDLNECREDLQNLKTLASLDQQTLTDLRTAVRKQVDDCNDRLRTAMSASSQ